MSKETSLLRLIILSNLIMGLYYIIITPISLDEPFSIFHAQMNVSEIINQLKGGNNPPLYEIILHFWIKIFGISPLSVRFPSLLFSLASILLSYKIVKTISTHKNAILSILLLTVSNYCICFTHEARAYSLFLLLTILFLYLIILVSESKFNNIWHSIFLIIVSSMLLYVHYFGLFVLLFLSAFFIIINFSQKKIIYTYLIICGFATLIFSPFIVEIYMRFTDSVKNGTWISPTEDFGNFQDMIYLFSNNNRYLFGLFTVFLYGATFKLVHQQKINLRIKYFINFGLIPLFFLCSISVFYSMPFIWRLIESNLFIIIFITTVLLGYTLFFIKYNKTHTYELLVIGLFLIPLLLFYAISFFIPIWVDRYLVFILPSFYITITLCISYLTNGIYYYLVSITTLVIMTFSINLSIINQNNLDKMIESLSEFKKDESIIIINPKHFNHTYAYHFQKTIFSKYSNFDQALKSSDIYSIYSTEDLKTISFDPNKNIIYIDANSKFTNPKNEVYTNLKETHQLIREKKIDEGFTITEFKKKQIKH